MKKVHVFIQKPMEDQQAVWPGDGMGWDENQSGTLSGEMLASTTPLGMAQHHRLGALPLPRQGKRRVGEHNATLARCRRQ